jgi:hypothetical protein
MSNIFTSARKEFVVRQYYLHTRNRIFYVQFTGPSTQKWLPAIFAGKSNRGEAVMAVALWLFEKLV